MYNPKSIGMLDFNSTSELEPETITLKSDSLHTYTSLMSILLNELSSLPTSIEAIQTTIKLKNILKDVTFLLGILVCSCPHKDGSPTQFTNEVKDEARFVFYMIMNGIQKGMENEEIVDDTLEKVRKEVNEYLENCGIIKDLLK